MVATGCDTQARRAHRGPAAQADVRDAAVRFGRRQSRSPGSSSTSTRCCRRSAIGSISGISKKSRKSNWQLDPLVGRAARRPCRNLAVVKTLDVMQYRLPDAWYLQESVWLRDISKLRPRRPVRRRGGGRAAVRLDRPQYPARTGRRSRRSSGQPASPVRNAAVWARQRARSGLDLHAAGAAARARRRAAGPRRRPRQRAAVAAGSIDRATSCICSIAAWACRFPVPTARAWPRWPQVVADDTLLRQLDLDDEHRYPVTANDLNHVVALVEAIAPAACRAAWRWSSRVWPASTRWC